MPTRGKDGSSKKIIAFKAKIIISAGGGVFTAARAAFTVFIAETSYITPGLSSQSVLLTEIFR